MSPDCVACRALALPGSLAAGVIFGIAHSEAKTTRLCDTHRETMRRVADSIRVAVEAEAFVDACGDEVRNLRDMRGGR